MQFIPVNEPLFIGNEKKYLNQCIESGWVSSEGSFVKKFEDTFSKYVDRKYGIAVCNGSAALDIAIKVLNIKAGDEVIMPTFTIISCALSIIRLGAIPVLVDCDPETWCMDTSQIEAKITTKTKAIMVVHIYGLPVDMEPVMSLAKKYNLKIIEDAAEAHGLEYKNKKCGSFGDLSVFSFYPNKIITTGEGGMVVSNDESLAVKCQFYRNLCFKAEERFVHDELGWNFRMSNIQAAIGLAQLEQIKTFIEKKKHIGRLYTKLLSSVKNIKLPITKTQYSGNIYWVYSILLKSDISFSANVAMQKLKAENIGTRPFFYPMHKQPVFKKMGLFKNESYPVSENLANKGFYIPSGLSITDQQIKYIAEKIKNLFA